MLKIAIIGAGSFTFGKKLITDLMTFPEIQKGTLIFLQDIDILKLEAINEFLQEYIEINYKFFKNVIIEKTLDQEKAINGAKYIINLTQVGGLDAFRLDLDIPLKYGVSQCVGDTLGPGGVFRFLRSVPFLDKLLLQIQNSNYSEKNNLIGPILFNYSNPMSMITWYCNHTIPNSTIGLCHGVTNTAVEIQKAININQEDFRYICAGINHMAWFLEILYREKKNNSKNWKNAYPLFYKSILKKNSIIEQDKIRIDMMKATNGYFMTESSGHLSEYLPYYRKRKDLIEKYKGTIYLDKLEHGIYFNKLFQLSNGFEESVDETNQFDFKLVPSTEDLAPIINSLETNSSFVFNGNVMNENGKIITNLPKNCCVEVPITIKNGFFPKENIELPSICSALCISNIIVQKFAVQAAISRDRTKIYHAILLDPNTASICSPSEIREMVDEMFEAQAQWVPEF